ncbi:hypothetical protein PR048_015511, partial [Dryococelus australis]
MVKARDTQEEYIKRKYPQPRTGIQAFEMGKAVLLHSHPLSRGNNHERASTMLSDARKMSTGPRIRPFGKLKTRPGVATRICRPVLDPRGWAAVGWSLQAGGLQPASHRPLQDYSGERGPAGCRQCPRYRASLLRNSGPVLILIDAIHKRGGIIEVKKDREGKAAVACDLDKECSLTWPAAPPPPPPLYLQQTIHQCPLL